MYCLRNNRVLSRLHNQPPAKCAALLLFTSYATDRKCGEAVTDRREQIAFPNQSRYHKEPRPARHIPTREQLQAADRRQVANEADGEADPSYSGHSEGIHPENAPFYSQDLTHSSVGRKIAASRAPITYDVEGNYVLEEGKEYYDTRLPTST
jgi:hypothetical protein